jgi:hypothetical protein
MSSFTGQRAWSRRGAAGDARKGMGEEITSPRRFTSSATTNTCFQLILLRFYRCICCHGYLRLLIRQRLSNFIAATLPEATRRTLGLLGSNIRFPCPGSTVAI